MITEIATPLLVSPRVAAEILCVSERKLYSLTQPRGPIPVVKMGPRFLRYSIAALERWIEEESTAGID